MTPQQYKTERRKRGTQIAVAQKLGIHPTTISNRETGAQIITREAWLALISLPCHPSKTTSKPHRTSATS